MFSRGRGMAIYDSDAQKAYDNYYGEEALSHLVGFDDGEEEALWREFETQAEGEWGSLYSEDSYSFVEEGAAELSDIPPKAGCLIDSFPSLHALQRDLILDKVKLLVEQELRKR